MTGASSGVETSLDLSVLEALDFEIECGHSQHVGIGGYGSHGGEVRSVIQIHLDCGHSSGIYPACDKWVISVVEGLTDILCTKCGTYNTHGEYTVDVRPLNESS